MPDVTIDESDAYELLSFLVASADICRHEPYHYGTFRLLDAASRLLGSMLRGDGNRVDDKWMSGFKQELDANKVLMMSNRRRYRAYIPEAMSKLAGELKRRMSEELAVPTDQENGEVR